MSASEHPLAFLFAEANCDEIDSAFRHHDNNQKYLETSLTLHGNDAPFCDRDREATPGPLNGNARLIFTLEPETFFDPLKGLRFGCDEDKVDVILDKDNARGISRVHFSVTHLWNEGPDPLTLILFNQSRNPIEVGGRILNLRQSRVLPSGQYLVKIGRLSLTLRIPELDEIPDPDLFKSTWHQFRQDAEAAVPRMTGLDIAQSHFNPTPHVDVDQTRRLFGEVKANAVLDRNVRRKIAPVESISPPAGPDKQSTTNARCVVVKDFKSAHSKLQLVRRESDGFRFVRKCITLNHVSEDRFPKRELAFAKSLRHSGIITVFASLIRNDCVELHLEYHELGDLWGYMNQRGIPLAVDYCTSLLQQMLDVLMYLVDLHVTHRDIKPENLLLVSISPISVKLIDFGLACYHRDSGLDVSLGSIVGTVSYAAPEMLSAFMGKSPTEATDLTSPKLDVWALGATIWFCAAREYVRQPEPGKASGVKADENAALPADGKAEPLKRLDDVEDASTIILPHAKPANTVIRAPGSKVIRNAKVTSKETSLISLAERNRALPASRKVPDGLVALLDRMLAADPADRASAQQCAEDQWLLKPFETDTQ